MTDEAEYLKLKKEWGHLLFGVRRSVRYHNRRRKFFDALSVWADFFIVISGGTVVAFAAGAEPKKNTASLICGAVIAIIGTFDLVIGFKTKTRDYHDLAKEFGRLEREMTSADDKKTKENLKLFKSKRLEIQENEPPILRVLNNYCHNELCRAMGFDKSEHVRIGFWQSFFKQWFDLFPSTMEKINRVKDDVSKQ